MAATEGAANVSDGSCVSDNKVDGGDGEGMGETKDNHSYHVLHRYIVNHEINMNFTLILKAMLEA